MPLLNLPALIFNQGPPSLIMQSDSPATAINLFNWRQPPHNVAAFHELPPEIATAAISADGAGVRPLPRSAKSLEAFALRLPNGGSLGLDQFVAATSTDAMLVLHRGALVYEVYRNGMTPSSPHVAMSATKAVVGLLTELLAADDAIALDAPVTAYVEEVASSPYAGTTVRQLLDMRNGVIFSPAEEAAYAQATGWEPHGDEPSGLQAFFTSLRGPAAPHGGPFRYHSATTDLLGWVLERATSKPLPALLSERLWRPIGATKDAAMTLDPAGFSRGAGGLCATIGDLARLGQVLADGGVVDQRQVVPARIIDDLVNGGDRAAWSNGQWSEAFAPISRTMAYRSGWYTVDGDPQILFAMGVHGQNLFVDRANDVVVAKFSSWAQPTDNRALWLTHTGVAEIGRCLA
ncbi:putative Beta-lactamase family protein; 6-aminohexanoate-dimer hydrolase [Bradyrhizobium sp. ORS 375]|uniref:serine hydrolase domain-containing protein n=1 Tax=Bradyrhizobium sp. (strain ORS 375) TaxID=566679 RepID=UPI000240967E|nr:serine hydrolase [Bradyrhizobium sp. ORS 375]CCD93359.1 putative Beta-lactamase family protein; 6-aminohexanoate-dimer hydrolase [Bradyrhizobium sp. ORS 375]